MKTLALLSNGVELESSRSEPVRLMKVITAFYRGGTEGQVLNLIHHLNHKRFELQFSCLMKQGEILGEFAELNIPIAEFRIRNLYTPNTFLQQGRFAAHLRAQRTEIVHSYNFYANLFAIPAARLARIPVVLASIRDRGVYLSPAQKVAQKWVCRLADGILVNAESIRDWLLEQGYEDSKIAVIKNGVDLSRYTSRKANSALRQELGIPQSAPIILMLSRLNPQKGVDDFIKSAALLNRSHPEARFLIVGSKLRYEDGEFSQDEAYPLELQRLATDYGVRDRVIFTGHRTDTPEILAESAISVLPSHSEGLSNSLLESMAAGVPIVATNVGGNPELVKEGVNGFLVPVGSPQHLARAMELILDDPALARRLGQQSRLMANEGFSIARMTVDTERLYLAKLSRSRRAMVAPVSSP